ncbi:SH3 domain-containing protein [Leptospira kanakyensis]|uniref:SH3 domain-containing protein n=1 Tax=Leptospira kanakyensis TaxID=2484968 RepID=A0A6N4Q6F5_9LEPT|nr:SH3 domain-containing protein [Leptospira kanakyensis]TGK45973.1 SH3 domain-containing protein [Leptospira kanakyensis]TGK70613.1 SH3 domain-containing protein [Leptospira kanakyensis]
MKKILTFTFILIFHLFTCKENVNNEISAEDKYYKVNVSALNLRKEPSISSDKLISLKKNRILIRANNFEKNDIIEGVSGKWIYVSTYEKTFGYIYEPYLKKAKLEKPYWEFETPNILSLCNKQTNDCFKKQTEYIFKKYKFISKTGNNLNIVGFDGSVGTFADKREFEDSIEIHTPLEVFFKDERYVLIDFSLYEGGSFILYDRKFNISIQLLDIPISSPNKEFLLVVSSADAYNTVGVQIVKLSEFEPKIVFQFKDKWRPCLGSWNSDVEVKVYECFEDYSFKNNDGMLYSERIIQFKNDSWELLP